MQFVSITAILIYMPNYQSEEKLIEDLRKGGPVQTCAVTWILNQANWRDAPVYQIRALNMSLDLKDEVFYESLSELLINVMKGDFKGKSTLRYYFERICRYNLLTRLTKKIKDSEYIASDELEEIIKKEVVDQLALNQQERRALL